MKLSTLLIAIVSLQFASGAELEHVEEIVAKAEKMSMPHSEKMSMPKM